MNIGCESPTFLDIDHGHLLALGFGSMDLEDLRPLYSCFWHLSANDYNAEISRDCGSNCWTGFQRHLRLPIYILTKGKIFSCVRWVLFWEDRMTLISTNKGPQYNGRSSSVASRENVLMLIHTVRFVTAFMFHLIISFLFLHPSIAFSFQFKTSLQSRCWSIILY